MTDEPKRRKAEADRTGLAGPGGLIFPSPSMSQQAQKIAECGATNEQIAKCLGVPERTFADWLVANADLARACEVGKEAADNRVERSLYQRALGYSHRVQKLVSYMGKSTVEEVEETVAPDVTAQIFWLKNRRPQQWRDRSQHDHTLKGDEAIAALFKSVHEGTAAIPAKQEEPAKEPNTTKH